MTYMSSQTSSLEPGRASVTYPTGWFWVAWSHEVSVEDAPRPLRYFGRDLVLYRGASGRPVVLDAHCPHPGAHLGYGGSVSDRPEESRVGKEVVRTCSSRWSPFP